MTESTIFNHLDVAVPYKYFHKPWLTELINQIITKLFVEQPLALPVSANDCLTILNKNLKKNDTWKVTRDTWQVTHDTYCGMNILSKFQLSSSSRLGLTVLWIYFHKPWLNYLITNWITKLFVEQPRLHRVC